MCYFCNLYDETQRHIFYKYLWSDVVQCFKNILILPTSTPQTAIFGILDSVSNNSFLETIKYLSITFYLYLSYMSVNPEKRNS